MSLLPLLRGLIDDAEEFLDFFGHAGGWKTAARLPLGDRALAHAQRGGDGGLGKLLALATLTKTGGKRRVCQVRPPGNITAFDDITYYNPDDSANLSLLTMEPQPRIAGYRPPRGCLCFRWRLHMSIVAGMEAAPEPTQASGSRGIRAVVVCSTAS